MLPALAPAPRALHACHGLARCKRLGGEAPDHRQEREPVWQVDVTVPPRVGPKATTGNATDAKVHVIEGASS